MRINVRIPSFIVTVALFVIGAGALATVALVPALFGIRTANAGLSTPLRTDKVGYDTYGYGKQNQNDNNIFHNSGPD